MSDTKPTIAAAVTVVPAQLSQRDPADLPMVQVRARHSIRRLTLGTWDGSRVGVHVEIAGPLLPSEIDDVLAELVAIREAARREQARQDAADERAAEVEALARDLELDELGTLVEAAEQVGNAGAVAVYLDALELQWTYQEDAAIELGRAAREARAEVA